MGQYVVTAAVCLMVTFTGQVFADTVKCVQPDGKATYQNWPCGTKPEVEKKPVQKPDYTKAVACGMANGLVGTVAAVQGTKPEKADCSKQ